MGFELLTNGQFEAWTPGTPTELLTDGGFEAWNTPTELLTDGGFEDWASATDLTSWTESVSGTSSVNKDESGSQYEGDYSCRLDIDASNSSVSIRQNISLSASVRHRLSFYYKTTGSATGLFSIRDESTADYLQADGSWDAAVHNFSLAAQASWTEYVLEFDAHSSGSDHRLLFNRNSAASESIYLDAASLQAADTLDSWTESISGLSAVVKDDTDEYAGSYCCRLDVDASNSNTYIYQTIALTASVRYRLSMYYKTTGTARCRIQIYHGGTGTYLQSDGTWGAAYSHVQSASASWSPNAPLEFAAHASGGNHVVYFMSYGATSESIYLDAAALHAVPTDCDGWTENLSGDSSIHKDVDNAYSGSACLRAQSGSSGEDADAIQTPTLTSGRKYRIKFRAKGDAGGETAQCTISENHGTYYYLKDDGSWASGWNNLIQDTETTSWREHEIEFTPQSTGSFRIRLSAIVTDQVLYFDSATLYELTERGWLPKPAWPLLQPHAFIPEPVGCWVGYEGAGETLNDVSRGRNHGSFETVNGGKPEWTTSPYGHALLFDDKGFVSFPHDERHTGDVLTVEVLFKLAELPSVSGRLPFIFHKLAAGVAYSFAIFLNNSNDLLYLRIKDDAGSSHTVLSSASVVVGEWYHAVISVSPGSMSAYINAVLQGTASPGSVYPAEQGVSLSSGLASRFNGTIAKAAIYDKALSHRAIVGLYMDPFANVRPENLMIGIPGQPNSVGRSLMMDGQHWSNV